MQVEFSQSVEFFASRMRLDVGLLRTPPNFGAAEGDSPTKALAVLLDR